MVKTDKNWGEIVRAYEVVTEDYFHVADALGMNRSIIALTRSIIALYIMQRKKSESENTWWTEKCEDR